MSRKAESFYRIERFEPVQHLDIGAYGFSIELDGDFAQTQKLYEIQPFSLSRLNEMGVKILKKIFPGEGQFIRTPFNFWEGTCLLTNVTVPGNACGLDMSHTDFHSLCSGRAPQESVQYAPHNVDNPRQAYALLSLWLKWFDSVSFFEKKLRG